MDFCSLSGVSSVPYHTLVGILEDYMRKAGHCQGCLSNLMGMTSLRGHLFHRSPWWKRRKEWNMAVKISLNGASKPGKPAYAETDTTLRSYPTLQAWLYDVVFDDGTPRQGGTLSVSGMWSLTTVWMNDKSSGLSASLSGPTLTDCLEAAEKGLKEGTLHWAPSRMMTSKAKRSH